MKTKTPTTTTRHSRPPLQLLSLGAGVQSSTLALMSLQGEIERPDAAIFADTGAEPQAVYDYLDWLESILPYPLHRVIHGEGLTKAIEDAAQGKASRLSNPPFFVKGQGSIGMLRRKCTSDFKIDPINKKIRKLVGLRPRQRSKNTLAVSYIGISLDEIQRCKHSRLNWIEHRWPLIEKRMTRHDCLLWLERHGYPTPPRSACVYCPYHSDAEYRRLQTEDPKSFREAVRIDRLIRNCIPAIRGKSYTHKSCLPLDQVDFTSKDEQTGQMNLWNAECDGMCGL